MGVHHTHCLCKSQHFQGFSEALRRNSTSILLRLFNTAMRLKNDSYYPHMRLLRKILGVRRADGVQHVARNCHFASDTGYHAAAFGAHDPCQASRSIGSILGGGLVGSVGRSQGMSMNNGAPRIPACRLWSTRGGGGVVWSSEGMCGGRGVPSLNTFHCPWGTSRGEENKRRI